MNEPVLQNKRQDHANFKKGGLKLLQKVLKDVERNSMFKILEAKIHKADAVGYKWI